MKSYMDFALGKAESHRGISTGRSLQHFEAWLWLLGDQDTLDYIQDDDNYANYGAPALKKICEVYNFSIPQEDWFENMANGKKCASDCFEGCGA